MYDPDELRVRLRQTARTLVPALDEDPADLDLLINAQLDVIADVLGRLVDRVTR